MAVAGAVAAVAEFRESDGDAGDGTEDLFDCVAAVRAGCRRGRVQAEDGCRPRTCWAARMSVDNSALSSTGRLRSLSTTLAVLSVSSFALPTARAASSRIACWIRPSC